MCYNLGLGQLVLMEGVGGVRGGGGWLKRGWLMFARYGKRDCLQILNYSPEVGMPGNLYFHCHMKKHLLLFLRLEMCLVWVVIHL